MLLKSTLGTVLSVVAILCAAFSVPHAVAQSTPYPVKPIRFIVPYTPGGSNDVVARIVGQKLSEYWGQPVIVENRPGVGGNLGAAFVARAPADGYTFLVAPNNLLTINPTLYDKDKVGYDPIKDFEPISFIGTAPVLLVVNARVPANSVKELIALAKSKPGDLSYASAGVGTPHHLSAELFKSMAGISMVHIPYRGAVPAVTDLVGGQVQVMFGITNSLLPYVKSGQLKALAVSGKKTVPYLPNIPTVSDAGLPGFYSDLWIGLVAPAGTPRDIIAKVNQVIAKAMSEADIKEKFAAQGLETAANSPSEFAAIIKADLVRWGKVIKDTGAKAE